MSRPRPRAATIALFFRPPRTGAREASDSLQAVRRGALRGRNPHPLPALPMPYRSAAPHRAADVGGPVATWPTPHKLPLTSTLRPNPPRIALHCATSRRPCVRVRAPRRPLLPALHEPRPKQRDAQPTGIALYRRNISVDPVAFYTLLTILNSESPLHASSADFPPPSTLRTVWCGLCVACMLLYPYPIAAPFTSINRPPAMYSIVLQLCMLILHLLRAARL